MSKLQLALGAVDEAGLLVLDSAGEYRYRPIRLAHEDYGSRVVLIFERVKEGA